MAQDYRLETDGSNLKEFMEHIDKRIANDFMSSSNFKSERESTDKLALELAGSVNAIEKRMATSIIELGLEDFFGAADSWFYIEEIRLKGGKDSDSVRTMSFGNNDSSNIYNNTYTLARNFDPGKMSDDGRFGKFFEDIFFGGGAGNESVSDMVEERIEVKSKTFKKEAKHVYAELKKGLLRHIRLKFPSGLAAGKVSSFKHHLNTLIKENKHEEASLFAQAIILDKFAAKMDNFLMAYVDSGTSKDDNQWVFDPSTGFEKAKYRMFFVKLYLYFHLIIEKVLKYVMANVKVERKVKPKGNFFKVRSDGTGLIKSLEINILQSMLPELETDLNEKGLIGKIMSEPTTFYSGLKILYDDTNPSNYETSKEYFQRIVNKYK